MVKMKRSGCPIPEHFDANKVGKIWRVDYETLSIAALDFARKHYIQPAAKDKTRICLLAVDVQNTFCLPNFELFVAGRSGTGAVDDTRRLCEFIYRNLDVITEICPTMDTHQALQIFHSIFFINDKGEHPGPYTLITVEDIQKGVWKVNPDVCPFLNMDHENAQKYLLHYTRELKSSGKYVLTVWPYHAMLGGIGHALVPAFEEALFFHSIARYSQPDFQIKGNHPLTEHYSVFGPEVEKGVNGEVIVQKNTYLIEKLIQFDAVIVAGQAKSHCVAWTIEDLLSDFLKIDRKLAEKVYLLEDCTSPVVIPGVVDYTDEAAAAFRKFVNAGMHVVKSTDPIESWEGFPF